MKIIADKDGWVPTKMRDYLNLAVGGRLLGVPTFGALLLHLALSAKGSFKTVNLVCYCPDFNTLAFKRDFVHSQQTGKTVIGNPDSASGPFAEVTVEELIQLNEQGSMEVQGGLTLSMDDVRSGLASDAEVRLYCIGEGASENIAHALANLLQVKVIAFTDAHIDFRVEVIEGAEISR